MALIVQKYGGTSIGSIDRIKSIAAKVKTYVDQNHYMVIVLSAMAGVTNSLIELAKQISLNPNPRELDVLMATGEQQSVALFAMAVRDLGMTARSLLGFQAAILTNRMFGHARINYIATDRIRDFLIHDRIVIVAGFQGIDDVAGDITTLGRGGSDTTAVALAGILNADICEIYTDVEGVFTADPNIVSNARKLKQISYEEMLEMASLGAKVLDIRSVALAAKFKIKIHVRSSFINQEGTMVIPEAHIDEKSIISGVAYNKNEARIKILGVPDRPGVAMKLFTLISDAGIVVDIIIQNTSADGYTDLTFTVPKVNFDQTIELVKDVALQIGAKNIEGDTHIAKISIIGMGMRNHAGVAAKMFTTLAYENINIQMISTSEIKISCVIDEKYTELAVRALHQAFDLHKDIIPIAEDLL